MLLKYRWDKQVTSDHRPCKSTQKHTLLTNGLISQHTHRPGREWQRCNEEAAKGVTHVLWYSYVVGCLCITFSVSTEYYKQLVSGVDQPLLTLVLVMNIIWNPCKMCSVGHNLLSGWQTATISMFYSTSPWKIVFYKLHCFVYRPTLWCFHCWGYMEIQHLVFKSPFFFTFLSPLPSVLCKTEEEPASRQQHTDGTHTCMFQNMDFIYLKKLK